MNNLLFLVRLIPNTDKRHIITGTFKFDCIVFTRTWHICVFAIENILGIKCMHDGKM